MKQEDIQSIVPLLPSQQFILTSSLNSDSDTYVQQLSFKVKKYSWPEIEAALTKLIDEYECFRSVILYEGLKQPVFVSTKNIFPKIDRQRINFQDFNAIKLKLRKTSFDFQKEPCIRFDWFDCGEENVFCITNHHILFDGWGKQKLLIDFVQFLENPAKTVNTKYKKNWYDAYNKLDQKLAISQYEKYLLNLEEYAELTKHSIESKKQLTIEDEIDADKFADNAKSLGLTLSEYFNFVWSFFISRHTGSENIQYGVVKQNGLIETVKNGFGLGIQTLPFQWTLNLNKTPQEHLDEFKSRERSVASYYYADTTHKIFQGKQYSFLMAYENYPIESGLDDSASDFSLIDSHDFSEFPLSLAITPGASTLKFDWHFNTSFHPTEQIEYLHKKFLEFSTEFDSYLHIPVKSISIIYTEKYSVKEDIVISRASFFERIENHLKERGSLQLFKELVSKFQNNNIKRIWHFGDKHLNTGILICAAWKCEVEVVMINEKETDAFVDALFTIKNPDIIFSSIIDNRIGDFIHLDKITAFECIKNEKLHVNSIAISICTSGSTGTPKVVHLSFDNWLIFLEAWDSILPWRKSEIFGIVAHPAFDVGVAEFIFPMWKNWDYKIVSKDDITDPVKMKSVFSEITAFHMVPALLENYLDSSIGDNSEKIIMTGGDKVPQRIQKKLANKFPISKLFQFYGPSECSVFVLGFENKGQFYNAQLPLGSSFRHANLFIVNKSNQISPPFQEGEIVIGGKAVGLGYANSEGTSKFTLFNGAKVFRSGDIGYSDQLGNLFFLGRKDHQIKINGQRIELTRIEYALKEWSGLDKWIAVFSEGMISAFGEGNNDVVLPDRDKLLELLPAYALPQFIEVINEFPLNKNGKIDIKTLQKSIQNSIIESPNNERLDEFDSVLLELFPTKKINFNLNWHSNGLNSIDALKFSGRLKLKLKKELSINHILTVIQLKLLSNYVTDLKQTEVLKIIPGIEVNESASRIFFLSESDEELNDSYWIISGFQFNNHGDFEGFLHKWIKEQKNLALSVLSKANKYIWKESQIKVYSQKFEELADFKEFVNQYKSSIFIGLIEIFLSEIQGKTFIAFKIHHGLLDGVGIQRLLESFTTALNTNEIKKLELYSPKSISADLNFWKGYLKNVKVQKLPFERIQIKTDVNFVRIPLSSSQKGKIIGITSRFNCSKFEASLILWSRLWYTYFPHKNFTSGVVVTTQNNWDETAIESMSVNMLPYLIESCEEQSILDSWRSLFDRRFESFSQIAQIEKNKELHGTPFFNTSIVYNNFTTDQANFDSLDFGINKPIYDISLDIVEDNEDLFFQWEYNPEKFSSDAVNELHNQFFEENEKELIQINKRSAIGSLREVWNDILQSKGQEKAISAANNSIRYSELNKKIEYLRGQIEFSGSGILLIKLDRTIENIALVLTCLIYDIPFIPVDSETPDDRIELIENLCGQKACNVNALINNIKIESNQNFDSEIAYCIATSGSTGIPKIVGVKRKGYLAAIAAWKEQYQITTSDKVLQAASFSFDVFLGDIGRSLFQGAELILLDKFERKDPDYILKTLINKKISLFETTPFIIRWWLDIGDIQCDSLRLLIVGSDSWTLQEMKQLISKSSDKTTVISSYGLSETTIDNSFFEISNTYSNDIIVPIGKPMLHSQISITDKDGNQLPKGKEGFLSLDGPCVGRGYFKGDKWTHLGNPWITEDRGCLDEYNNFHFLGRSDRQVKIRGQRLELQEIESILKTFSNHIDWFVFDYDNGISNELVTAFTKTISNEEINDIRGKILQSYPSYYLPAKFIQIEQFEMNQNGKVDLEKLRKFTKAIENPKQEISYSDETLDMVKDLTNSLFTKKIEAKDNFFEIGLSSFDAMYFVREWNRLFDKKIKVFQLFLAKNMGDLVLIIDKSQFHDNVLNEFNGEQKANKAQEAIWIEVEEKGSSIFNLPHIFKIPNTENNFQHLAEQTLKSCRELFCRFYVSDQGDLRKSYLDPKEYQLIEVELSERKFINFKKNVHFKELDLESGPCFEANILNVAGENYFYFNPHHIAYDGGSDAVLSNIYTSIKKGIDYTFERNFCDKNEVQNDWDAYFNLSTAPSKLNGNPAKKLENAISYVVDKNIFDSVELLQKEWKTGSSVVHAILLSESLSKISLPVNWVSLAMDTRDVPEVGMYMRAFPLPCNSNIPLANRIGKTKAALSGLLKHKNSQIIYPLGTTYHNYHQIGLVIQHPAQFAGENSEQDANGLCRPKQPLTLYVEIINDNLIFRWEYDSGYFNDIQIKKAHIAYMELIKENATNPIEPIVFKMPYLDEMNASVEEIKNSSLLTIWNNYVSIENSTHFFKGGGTSLKAIMMLKEIKEKLDIDMSIMEFFKNPTINFIASISEINNKSQELFLEWNSGEHEEWYFPPIFGLGLIYANYPKNSNTRCIAFNYPMAMDSPVFYESIEELAYILLTAYQKTNVLPKKIKRITAYSMGGIIAFEVIKLLELMGVEIEEFIIWDKPSQCYLPKDEIHVDITKRGEILSVIDELVDTDIERKKMITYLNKHEYIIEKYFQKGMINCDIRIYYCSNGFKKEDLYNWEKLTSRSVTFIELKNITHYEIPEFWKSMSPTTLNNSECL